MKAAITALQEQNLGHLKVALAKIENKNAVYLNLMEFQLYSKCYFYTYNPLLHQACQLGYVEGVKLLLEEGADPNHPVSFLFSMYLVFLFCFFITYNGVYFNFT